MKRLINMCLAKLHRLTVTGADLDYEGSITIDSAILEKAGLLPGQMVQITNLSNAVLWRTYIVAGKEGEVVLNGPPARHFQKGDKIIVLAEVWVDCEEAKDMRPTIVFVNEKNQITQVKCPRN